MGAKQVRQKSHCFKLTVTRSKTKFCRLLEWQTVDKAIPVTRLRENYIFGEAANNKR